MGLRLSLLLKEDSSYGLSTFSTLGWRTPLIESIFEGQSDKHKDAFWWHHVCPTYLKHSLETFYSFSRLFFCDHAFASLIRWNIFKVYVPEKLLTVSNYFSYSHLKWVFNGKLNFKSEDFKKSETLREIEKTTEGNGNIRCHGARVGIP